MRRVLLGILILGLSASSAFAQGAGQINGALTDSSGGVIPGATVAAIESGTGIRQETVTGANGRYSFPSIRPTTYEIRAELTGFKSVRRTDIILQANQNLTVNITLELGDLSETITVAGDTATVDISSATISEVVDHARIVELPIAGREVARLQTLVAGTVVAAISEETAKSLPGAVRVSANGAGERQNAYRLDGASNTDPYYQENQSFPFPDALQEFSIQTSNYSAQHGNNAGAVVNVVTRSGTNSFHGGAFEYIRDRKFNEKNYFAPEKDFLKRNQYGGFAGGPIRRNSTFFFAGWQRTRITNKASDLIRFVPTAAQRAGDFSSCTPACPQLFSPTTGLPYANNRIPANEWDPAAVKVFAALPTSSSPDGRVNIPKGTDQDSNQFVMKIDQQIGSTNQFIVRYFLDDFNNKSQFIPGNILSYTAPSLESNPRSNNIVAGWKKTLSSTLLNEATFGFNKLNTARSPHPDVPDTRDFGIRLPYFARLESVSEIRAQDYFNFGDNLEGRFPRDGFQFNNKTNWIKGRHGMMFGAEFEYLRPEIYNDFRRQGHFISNGQYTRAPGAASGGHALADFLLGRLSTFDHGTGEYKNYRGFYQSYFFQDDVRLTDRITLNLGARYEPTGPWHDLVGRFQDFDEAAYRAGTRSAVFPTAPPGLFYRGDAGVAEDGTLPDRNNVAGRFGFAWDVTGDGKTSIRGGGGMFYDTHLLGEFNNGGVNAPPWSIRVNIVNGGAPNSTLVGPLSDPYAPRSDFNALRHEYDAKDTIIGSPVATFPTPVIVESFDEVFNTPLTYNYNLSFEREVSAGWMARAAYVGSTATTGRGSITLNPAIFVAGGTAGNVQGRRRFPEYGGINHFIQDRESQYQALQLTLNRRYANGFTVNTNYTLSDLQGTIEGTEIAPYFHPDIETITDTLMRGRMPDMRRHRFVTSWVYDVPGVSNAMLNHVVGGWQVTGIYQWQSGKPYTVVSGVDNSGWGLGGNNNRAIRTGQPLEAPAGSDETIWFNPAAFAVNPIGTFGETGRGEMFGPTFSSVDMGLFKRFRFSDDVNIQFRAEIFNLFNQVNFDIPGASPGDNRTSANNANYARITRTVPGIGDPRIMQFGLKFLF